MTQLHARQHANPPGEVWFRVSCAQTIDATAADCTLPDQHDAGERGTAKFGNGARRAAMSSPLKGARLTAEATLTTVGTISRQEDWCL
jgi:hypothetical protein